VVQASAAAAFNEWCTSARSCVWPDARIFGYENALPVPDMITIHDQHSAEEIVLAGQRAKFPGLPTGVVLRLAAIMVRG